MKNIKKLCTLHFVLCAMLLLALMTGCKKPMDEITDPDYSRLFSPNGVTVKVENIINATITWETVKNAKKYVIELSQPDDPTFTDAVTETLDGEVVTKSYYDLTESVTYYFRVKATGENISESKWRGTTFKTTPPYVETTTWNLSDEVFQTLPADFTETQTVGGLTFVAATGKNLQYKSLSTPIEFDGFTFTHTLDLRGASNAKDQHPYDMTTDVRTIKFTLTKASVVTVYGGSASAGRPLRLVDKTNTILGEVNTTTNGVVTITAEIPSAGDYYVYSYNSGINVYAITACAGCKYEKDHNAALLNMTVTGVTGLRDGEEETDSEQPINTLLPSFDPEILIYDYYVAASTYQLTINATKAHVNQKITGAGINVITANEMSFPVKVTAEDGTTNLTYTINIHRKVEKSNDATLKTLSVSAGSLTPDFDPEITEYVDSVSNSVESLTITGVANHPFAFTLGSISAENLVVGENGPYTITVVAEDHSTKEYKVTVVRKAPEGGQIDPIIYNFSAEPFLTELASYVGSKLITTNVTVNGVTFLADGTGNEMTYNTKSLSSADGLYNFTHRIGTEGSGNTVKRSIKFSVDGPCTITVYSESNNATDPRGIKIFNTTETLFTEASVLLGEPAKKHEYVYTGAAGELYVTSSTSASNIYLIQIQY